MDYEAIAGEQSRQSLIAARRAKEISAQRGDDPHPIVRSEVLQKRHEVRAQIFRDGVLQLLELVDDDQQAAARGLLREKLVDPTAFRELFRRIGAKCRATWWWQERLEPDGERTKR